MAKKFNGGNRPNPTPNRSAGPAMTTAVRNSAVPRPSSSPAPASRREITHEMIARRAYEIYVSGRGGSQEENWLRAERELRGS